MRRVIYLLVGCWLVGTLSVFAGNSVRNGVFAGYSSSCLIGSERYQMLPLIYRVGYDFSENGSLNLEPYVGRVCEPTGGWEFGLPIFLRWKHRLYGPLAVFVDGGAGPMLLGVSTHEEAKRFNFVDQVGLGFEWRLADGRVWEVGGRFRHVSNAGLHDVNAGIDGITVHMGVTF